MQSVLSLAMRQGLVVAILLLPLIVTALPLPVRAQSLFTRHEVTVEFATSGGKPLANAEVRVFAPGQPDRPAQTGHTDSGGRFQFFADRDGFWSAEARSGDEIGRVMVRVGGQQGGAETLSPYWLLGGLLLLLVVAFGYRVALARRRRANRPGSPPRKP
ncbi:MAG: hypothetical protein ACM3JG_01215 [Thiohalocapsa sp.]